MLIMEINKDNPVIEISNNQLTDNIEIVNKRNSSKKKQNKRKHKISFVDTPQRNMHHSFSNDTNNNNNNILATNLSFAKKKVYNSKKIEEIKTQNKLIKLIKYTKKSKIPINKRNGQVLSLSIKPVPFVIPMKNKNERIDRNGIAINKTNKKKVHITFIDKVEKCNLVEDIQVESYKQYNTIEELQKNELLVNKNKCCFIY